MLNKTIQGCLVALGVIGFSGCGSSFSPSPATVKYVEENKLVNEDYEESEIMCVSDGVLTKEQRDDIFLYASTRFHADFSNHKCTKDYKYSLSYKKIDIANYRYKNCQNFLYFSVAESEKSHFVRYSPTAYKIEFKHYNGVVNPFTQSKDSQLFGYVGFEDVNNSTVVYVSDTSNDDKSSESKTGYLKEGVLNYMKQNPSVCKAF